MPGFQRRNAEKGRGRRWKEWDLQIVWILSRTSCPEDRCQRVAIARAIVNNPKLLLADEPTGALDSKSGAQVMELFQRLNEEGVSVLMITHDAEIASHAKRVVTIKDGILQEKR